MRVKKKEVAVEGKSRSEKLIQIPKIRRAIRSNLIGESRLNDLSELDGQGAGRQ